MGCRVSTTAESPRHEVTPASRKVVDTPLKNTEKVVPPPLSENAVSPARRSEAEKPKRRLSTRRFDPRFAVSRIAEDSPLLEDQSLSSLVGAAASKDEATFPWRLGAVIGSGAGSSVYLGLNEATAAFMAVKKVAFQQSDLQKIRLLKFEIDLLRKLRHPNIVQFYGSSLRGSSLFIFTEWVCGGSLADLLHRFGRLAEPLVRLYTRQLLMALDYMHSQHFVHRDVKAANVLVDDMGNIRLADFGAAKRYVSTARTASVAAGADAAGRPHGARAARLLSVPRSPEAVDSSAVTSKSASTPSSAQSGVDLLHKQPAAGRVRWQDNEGSALLVSAAAAAVSTNGVDSTSGVASGVDVPIMIRGSAASVTAASAASLRQKKNQSSAPDAFPAQPEVLATLREPCSENPAQPEAILSPEVLATLRGTPYFSPPECLTGAAYGRKGDIWALGCTVLQMITGQPPWKPLCPASLPNLVHLILNTPAGPPVPTVGISNELRSFLASCFCREPQARPSAAQLLSHLFVSDVTRDSLLDGSAAIGISSVSSAASPPSELNSDSQSGVPRRSSSKAESESRRSSSSSLSASVDESTKAGSLSSRSTYRELPLPPLVLPRPGAPMGVRLDSSASAFAPTGVSSLWRSTSTSSMDHHAARLTTTRGAPAPPLLALMPSRNDANNRASALKAVPPPLPPATFSYSASDGGGGGGVNALSASSSDRGSNTSPAVLGPSKVWRLPQQAPAASLSLATSSQYASVALEEAGTSQVHVVPPAVSVLETSLPVQASASPVRDTSGYHRTFDIISAGRSRRGSSPESRRSPPPPAAVSALADGFVVPASSAGASEMPASRVTLIVSRSQDGEAVMRAIPIRQASVAANDSETCSYQRQHGGVADVGAAEGAPAATAGLAAPLFCEEESATLGFPVYADPNTGAYMTEPQHYAALMNLISAVASSSAEPASASATSSGECETGVPRLQAPQTLD